MITFTYKRILSILFICFTLTGYANTQFKNAGAPQLSHGTIQRNLPDKIRNHITFDEMKQEEDITSADQNLLSNPDFAYPKTVEKDAESVYKSALKSHKPVTAMRAAMQINIAQSSVNSDSVQGSLDRYEEIAIKFGEPYAALANLLSARLLLDIYLSDRYNFDQRTLPEETNETNPLLWDGNQFKKKITELCNSVLRQSDILSTLPIASISPLITNSPKAEKAGMTLFDFAAYRIIDLLNPIYVSEAEARHDEIPFTIESSVIKSNDQKVTADGEAFTTQILSPLEVIDKLIRGHQPATQSDSPALLQAQITRLHLLNGMQSRRDSAVKLLQDYPVGNNLRPELLLSIINTDILPYDTEVGKKEMYSLVEETVQSYPDHTVTECLKSFLQEWSNPAIRIIVPEQVSPYSTDSISYKNENLKDFYILLVPVKQPDVNRPLRQKDLSPTSSNIIVISHIIGDLPIPFSTEGKIDLPSLSPGYYAMVASATSDLRGLFTNMKELRVPVINVCGFSVFTTPVNNMKRNKTEEAFRVFVTDTKTGRPIKGATFKCMNREYSRSGKIKGESYTGVTDSNGSFICKYQNNLCEISYHGSRMLKSLYSHFFYGSNSDKLSITTLTDLAIYRPGDTIQTVSIVALNKDNKLSAAQGKNISVKLFDTNYQEVDKQMVTTDNSGRAIASLKIPTDRLTGSYMIRTEVNSAENQKEGTSTTYVEVADYKAPSFRVSLDQPEITEDTLELSGIVTTYSGMPLSDNIVEIKIEFNESWWWRRTDLPLPTHFMTKVSTGKDGIFKLKLGISSLLDKGYTDGYFNVTATCTSDAGETESAHPQNFFLSQGYSLTVSAEPIEAKDKEINIYTGVSDILGQPVKKELSYKLSDEKGNIVSEGNFLSPILTLQSIDIPSGTYNLSVILSEAQKEYEGIHKGEWRADTTNTKLIVWRLTDECPPTDVPLWIPIKNFNTGDKDSSADYVDVIVGSGIKDGCIYYQTADCDSILSEGWLYASERNVSLRVPVPASGNRILVRFRGQNGVNSTCSSVTVYPVDYNRQLSLTTHTFRDKIYPGMTENWTFSLTLDGQPVKEAPVMAVLSDAALNSITPFKWIFNPASVLYFNIRGGINTTSVSQTYFSGNPFKLPSTKDCPLFSIPDWNTWNRSLYFSPSRIFLRGNNLDRFDAVIEMGSLKNEVADIEMESVPMMSSKMSAKTMNREDLAAGVYTDTYEEAIMTEMDYGGLDGNAGVDIEDIPLRNTQQPLAFFKPMLLTGNEGQVNVSFDVPNFNTTWALQMLAYDENMQSAYIVKEIVAAKPVMITTNMPRFLLTGDKSVIAATIFNNSEESLKLNGRIEVIEPQTGKVIALSDSGDTLIEASGNITFTAEILVPDNCGSLIIRSMVRSERGSDGEQELIQILPSSQPVLDATTFYFTPEERELNIKLPKMGSEDMVTLNYCANPAWFVLTSLSGFIRPESESTLTNLNALFANCVAGGLIGKYPSLRYGLSELFNGGPTDSLLFSPLQQKEELKISTLINTPWVNNARSERERMAGLETLLDSEKGEEVITSIVESLQSCRMSDGSFKWFPQMREGSLWITLNVLDCAAAMKENGYTPKSVKFQGMVRDAIRYADIELGKSFRELVIKRKGSFSLTMEIDYFLNRSMLTNNPVDGQLSEMHKDLMRRLPKEWRKLGIYHKAKAARLLKRDGQGKLAREIMESVLQFATYKPDKGMWFDHLHDDWFSPSPKMVTASVMLALSEVMPGNEALIKMAQYLVLSRQTEDWNLDMSPAAVTTTANAVLSADLGWNDSTVAEPPVITLDGEPLILPAGESLAGNIWLSFTPGQASGKILAIKRLASTPAWGGVLRQHVAPVKDVKMASVPQLKVTKRLIPVVNSSSGQVASKAATRFSKGELVRVTLTLETDRDLDYVIVNDCRGAFMQPADQLTEYTFQNGLWILRETRNSATNFYMTSLPKGSFIITYDVYADREGEYSTGITTTQSQYYPLITAHSAGCLVSVE